MDACVSSVAVGNVTVNIAVLTWVPDAPYGYFEGNLASPSTVSNIPGYGSQILQPYNLGLQFYIDMMRANGPMPLANEGTFAHMHFVTINLANNPKLPQGYQAEVDYDTSRSTNGLPNFIIDTTNPTAAFSATDPIHGLFARILSQDTQMLSRDFGINTPFQFIIPPVLIQPSATQALALMTEQNRTAIIIHPLTSSREMFVCDGIDAPAPFNSKPITYENTDTSISLTPDCLSTRYNRKRRAGARRFETLFSVLVDSAYNQNAALDSFHTLGIKRVAILRAPNVWKGSTFPKWAGETAANIAEQLNIQVVEMLTLVTRDVHENITNLAPSCRNCPPTDTRIFVSTTVLVLPEDETGTELALRWKRAGVEALIILLVAETSGCWTVAQLWHGMKANDWSPKAISFGGNPEQCIQPFLPDPKSDLDFTWTTKPWDSRLRGPSYKNIRTETSFELLPSTPSSDGPSVWHQEYDRRFGPVDMTSTVPQHPMWQPVSNNFWSGLGWAVLNLAQKMVEAAQSDHVNDLLTTSKSMSFASMWHDAQFDRYGRLARVNEVLFQRIPLGVVAGSTAETDGLRIVSPYNIGETPVFPAPTWSERSPMTSLHQSHMRIAIHILTAFTTCFLSYLGVYLFFHRNHTVVRAADPVFCFLALGGALVLVSANWFNSYPHVEAACQAPIWFYSLGFTILYANLFVKTYRAWRIYYDTSYQLRPFPVGLMLILVGVCLAIEIGLNLAWQLHAPVESHKVQRDVFRPSYDYYECLIGNNERADGYIFLYVQIGFKCTWLMVGAVLSLAARNLPRGFNESFLIAVCIYQTSLVLVIGIVLSFYQSVRGSNDGIRDLTAIFISLGTCIVIFLPKVIQIRCSVMKSSKHKAATLKRPDVITPTKHEAVAVDYDVSKSCVANNPLSQAQAAQPDCVQPPISPQVQAHCNYVQPHISPQARMRSYPDCVELPISPRLNPCMPPPLISLANVPSLVTYRFDPVSVECVEDFFLTPRLPVQVHLEKRTEVIRTSGNSAGSISTMKSVQEEEIEEHGKEEHVV